MTLIISCLVLSIIFIGCIKLRQRYTLCKMVAYTGSMLIFLLLTMEAITRVFLFVQHKEPGLLVYPYGVQTDNYLRLEWSSHKENDQNISTLRIMQGIEYYKATLNKNIFRFSDDTAADSDLDIFCFGGSTTLGLSIDEDTYPAYLQRRLQGQATVFNLGKAGHSSADFLNNLQHSDLVGRVIPEVAVFYMMHNDAVTHHRIFPFFQTAYRYFGEMTEHNPLIKVSVLMRHLSVLWSAPKISAFIQAGLVTPATDFNPPEVALKSKAMIDNMQATLQKLKEINPNIQILLIPEFANYGVPVSQFIKPGTSEILSQERAAPTLVQEAINFDFVSKIKALQTIAQTNTQTSFFIPPFYQSIEPEQIMIDLVHLNSKGNELLALATAKQIEDMFPPQ